MQQLHERQTLTEEQKGVIEKYRDRIKTASDSLMSALKDGGIEMPQRLDFGKLQEQINSLDDSQKAEIHDVFNQMKTLHTKLKEMLNEAGVVLPEPPRE